MNEKSLSSFQRICLSGITEHLALFGFDVTFSIVPCQDDILGDSGDVFLRSAKFNVNKVEVQFFIYSEEAGFFCDGEWNIFEVQDYPGSTLLLDRLLAQVNECAGLV